ncbi:DNA-binding HTH domain, TetR-type [Acidimicrobiia bacterium]
MGRKISAAEKPPRVSRAQRTKNVQTDISAAALKLLSTKGVDGLSLTKVAAEAGLSNGPLYGRYDSPEDVALELWEGSIRDRFHLLLDEAARFALGDAPDPSEWLVTEMTNPSAESLAVVETIAVARRYPMLAESVRTEVDSALQKIRTESSTIPFSAIYPWITLPLGAIVYSGMLPSESPPWADILRVGRQAAIQAPAPTYVGSHPAPLELNLPNPDTGDLGLDEFVTAVMLVVTRVGYEKATAQRVARAAGHSFSSAYTHVESKDELMMFAITAMIDQIIMTGDESFLHMTGDELFLGMIALELGLISDNNRSLRQLRAESLVAARHHKSLGEILRTRLIESAAHVRTAEKSETVPLSSAFWYGARANGMTSLLLSLNTRLLDDVDWMPFGAMVKELTRLIKMSKVEPNR